ncbi:nucleoid-associated protein [Vibrio lentus]|uniref:nucleoid-associated protein n=1 Tax=Vibrio lentus TaxID=136468 RepID=UPI000C868135|nr:nucleoid-associated protein [Vibrio lentus]PMJ59446.1 hypothetical protein BCU18_10240 [Vibrio lentus]PMM60252.1 hypothetical protein BCT51_03760 [Vibrio lentus]
MLEVVNAIAYRGSVTEEQDKKRVWSTQAGVRWSTESKNVIDFVQKSNAKIGDSFKEYTTFRSLENASPKEFPVLLKQYHDSNHSAGNFKSFHENYVKHKLEKNLQKSNLKEGAVIVFVHYRTWSDPEVTLDSEGEKHPEPDFTKEILEDKFSVLMVRNTGALKFNKDLQLDSIDVIDLKQFVQGCQIDVKRFSNPSGEVDGQHDNYLAFIKGGADIRDYFKDALFAEDSVTNKLSTENFKRAFDDFCVEYSEEMPRSVKDTMQSKIFDLSQAYKNLPVTLDLIGAEIDGCIPAKMASLRGQFVKFANEGPYEINEEFALNAAVIKDFVYVELDVGFGMLKLTKESIGNMTESRNVAFDQTNNKLTLSTTLSKKRQIDLINNIIK